MIAATAGVSASRISASFTTIVLGAPSTRSRPQISVCKGFASLDADPMPVSTRSAVRLPISRLYLRLTYRRSRHPSHCPQQAATGIRPIRPLK